MVSVVIPAFNEAATVAGAVAAAVDHAGISEVIVVDDGSTDDTAALAAAAGARVIRLERNAGKAAAMDAGVRSATADVIVFVDADIIGLDGDRLTRIMQPVVDGRLEMHVGIRGRRTIWLNWLLRISPILGGERAVTRRLWQAVPNYCKRGFRIEIALNHTAKQFDRGMGFELIDGVGHNIKERKYGVLPGLIRRFRMMVEILAVSFRLYVVDAIGRRLRRLMQRAGADRAGRG